MVVPVVHVPVVLLVVAAVRHGVGRVAPAVPLMMVVLIAIAVAHRHVSEIHMYGGLRHRRNGDCGGHQRKCANARNILEGLVHWYLPGKRRWLYQRLVLFSFSRLR